MLAALLILLMSVIKRGTIKPFQTLMRIDIIELILLFFPTKGTPLTINNEGVSGR